MRVSSVLSAILLIGTCVAQQTVPDSKVVIRSSTREVLLEVVVRDARGRLVKKIDPEQVAVYEDGVELCVARKDELDELCVLARIGRRHDGMVSYRPASGR